MILGKISQFITLGSIVASFILALPKGGGAQGLCPGGGPGAAGSLQCH